MSRLAGIAVVIGGAAGAFLGAALLTSPAAYADAAPSPVDFELPGSPGVDSPIQQFGLCPLYCTGQFDTPWTIYDQNTGDVLGDYETHASNLQALFLSSSSEQVIDSTGAAPAVGSLWNMSDLGIPVFFGPVAGLFEPLQNFYESDPTGVMQDLFQINFGSAAVFGNYFSTGPTGTLDELIFLTNYVVPILDIPAAASTDAGSLWSDIAAMF